MSVFFTSDLHLGHRLAAEKRGFDSVEAHDEAVLEPYLALTKRSKLFILGDVAFSTKSYELLRQLRCLTVLVMGNHDQFQASKYLQVFRNLHGALKYHGWFLTHIPVHPQELYRVKGNIHGHIHRDAATLPIDDPRYFNVNWDFQPRPVPFDEIDATVT